MKRFYASVLLGVLTVMVSIPGFAKACPSCQIAIEATTESNEKEKQESPGSTDVLREARAYNYSIYLMVTMPYLLLGTFGYLIYRGVKKNEQWKQSQEEATPPTE